MKALVLTAVFASGWGLLAQQAPANAPTVTRTVLLQQDVTAAPGLASALVRVDLPVGGREGRHQHPGMLIVHVLEGVLTLDYEGKPTTQYKVGDTFSVEPGKVHEGINRSNAPVKLLASFVFPKDKPMTVQVP
jgi:quercetin dioxygenase-like cupin family protein